MRRVLTLVVVSLAAVVSARGQIREEVVELRSGDCTLQGSLMLPTGFDYSSVALLVSSTATADRDGNEQVMRNYALKMVATALAQHGIASLRYDKRGVGMSRYNAGQQGQVTLSTHASDIENLVSSLKRDKRFARVVVVGHGVGSLISMIALSRGAPAAGFISLEGVGRSFDQVLKDQLSNQPIQVRDIAYEIIDTLKSGKPYAGVPVFLSSFFAPQLQPYLISSMKYNPQLLIRSLKLPILVVHGDTDIKVKVEDARLLSAANPNSKLVVIAGMNHVLKNCPSMERTVQIPTYANPALPLSEALVAELVKFIKGL